MRSCAFPLVVLLLAACSSDARIAAPADASVFRRFVTIGTGLTMGERSGGVVYESQIASWPVRLAARVDAAFRVPSFSAPGCTPPLVAPLSMNRTLDGEIVAGTVTCGGRLGVDSLPANNLAIAGATAWDALHVSPHSLVTQTASLEQKRYPLVLPSLQTQLQAMQMTFFFFLPSMLLTGFMFPFRGMPVWAQWIGEGLPLTHFLRIVRGILLKGNTAVEMLPHLLPREDEEVCKDFEKQVTRAGMKWKTGAKVEKAERKDGIVQLHVTTPQGTEIVPAQKVLVAIGVQPNSDGIGLEALGVKTDRGAVVVDDYYQTNVPGLYAIGDLNMKLALAHVASAQGLVAIEHMANKEPRPLDYNAIPRCTYSLPQVASLGLTEAQAREQYGDGISIGRFPFRANGKALGLNDYEGFIKIIADKKFGEILGVHMIGPEVTDLTGEFSLAKSMELTPLELAHAVHAHPTLTEAIGEAALDVYGEAIHI